MCSFVTSGMLWLEGFMEGLRIDVTGHLGNVDEIIHG